MLSETGNYHPDNESPKAETIKEQNERYYLEAVEEYIKELYPEDTPDKREPESVTADPKSLELENRIRQQFIADVLPEYGVPQEVVDQLTEIEGTSVQLWELPPLENTKAPELPDGYAYCGGVARAHLLKKLGIDPKEEFRDKDLVRIGGEEGKTELDKKLERLHMPEDSKHGYGVQRYEDLQSYFKTRDFTMSEALSDKDGIAFTPECLLDTVRGIIRLSEFERKQLSTMRPKTKVLAKAIRLFAQGMVEYGNPHLDKEITAKANQEFIGMFYQALHLVRAMEHSNEAAARYIDTLIATKSLPKEIATIEEAAAYYAARIRDRSSYFREAPHTQYLFENDLLAHASVELEAKLAASGNEAMDYGSLEINDPIELAEAYDAAKKRLKIEEVMPKSDMNEVDDELENQFDDVASGKKQRYKLR